MKNKSVWLTQGHSEARSAGPVALRVTFMSGEQIG